MARFPALRFDDAPKWSSALTGAGRALFEGAGWPVLLASLDAAAALAATALAPLPLPAGLVLVPLLIAGLGAQGMYAAVTPGTPDALRRILTAVVAAGLGVGVLARLTEADIAEALATTAVFAVALVSVERAAAGAVRTAARRRGAAGRRCLILGAGHVGIAMEQRLRTDGGVGLDPVGFLDADPRPDAGGVAPVLGGLGDLDAALTVTGAEVVLVAFAGAPDSDVVEAVRACQERGVEVLAVPRLYEAFNRRATPRQLGSVQAHVLGAGRPGRMALAAKSGADRLIAVAGLLALAPLLLALAAAVKLDSRGPVLYRQTRIGRGGRPFSMLKFRSMRTVVPGAEFRPHLGLAPGGVEGDDRRTRVGRWMRAHSLDELPQLINVARGDMSLVGPRPERPEYVESFSASVPRYDDRHRVNVGITGWAQVRGLRGQTSIDDRIAYDNFYIENWSPGLDLRVLAATVAAATDGE